MGISHGAVYIEKESPQIQGNPSFFDPVFVYYTPYYIQNNGNTSENITIKTPILKGMVDYDACISNTPNPSFYYNEYTISCSSGSVKSNTTLEGNYIVANLNVPANTTEYYIPGILLKSYNYMVKSFVNSDSSGTYTYFNIYFNNPYTGKIYIPLSDYSLDNNVSIQEEDDGAFYFSTNYKVEYINGIPFLVGDVINQDRITLRSPNIHDPVNIGKTFLVFTNNPINHNTNIQLIYPEIADNFVFVPFLDSDQSINVTATLQDGNKVINIPATALQTPSGNYQLKPNVLTVKFSSNFSKELNLTFYQMNEVDFQNNCGKTFSEAGISSSSGTVYVYNSTFGDLKDAKCWMVLEDTNSSFDYDKLLIDNNGNTIFNDSVDFALDVNENTTYNPPLYLNRSQDGWEYKYWLERVPDIQGTESEVNLTFFRIRKELVNSSAFIPPLVNASSGLTINNNNSVTVILTNNNDVYYMFSDNVSDLDNLDTVIYKWDDFVNSNDSENIIYYLLSKSFSAKEIQVEERSGDNPNTRLYFGLIPVYNPTSNSYDWKLVFSTDADSKVYLANQNHPYFIKDAQELFDTSKETIEGNRLDNYQLKTIDPMEKEVNFYSGDFKEIRYTIPYDFYNEEIDKKTFTDLISHGEIEEYTINITATTDTFYSKQLTFDNPITTALCYMDGNIVNVKKINDYVIEVATTLTKGNHQLICDGFIGTADISKVEETTQGNTQIIKYQIGDHLDPVKIEVPIYPNQIVQKICINELSTDECDTKIDTDQLSYEYKNGQLYAYVYTNVPKYYYIKIVKETLTEPLKVDTSKEIDIIKDQVIGSVSLTLKNIFNEFIPYTTYSITTYPGDRITMYINGDFEDITDKVKKTQNSDGTYTYNFIFSSFIPGALPSFQPLETKYIQIRTNANLDVNYKVGSILGGEYQDGYYLLTKTVNNPNDYAVDVKVFMDEVPLSSVAYYVPVIGYDDNLFKVENITKLFDAVAIKDTIKANEVKDYSLYYVKKGQDITYGKKQIDSAVYTDLSKVLNSDFRDAVDEYVQNYKDKEFLLEGELLKQKINETLNEIKDILKKDIKNTTNKIYIERILEGMGITKDYDWNQLTDSKDFFLSIEDYERILTLEDDVIQLVDDLKQYYDTIGDIEDAISGLKSCLEENKDDRQTCYQKYLLLPQEIQKLEECLKQTNDNVSKCVNVLRGNFSLETLQQEKLQQQQEEEKKKQEILKLKTDIEALISGLKIKIQTLLAMRDQLTQNDIETLTTAQAQLDAIENKLASVNDIDKLKKLYNQLQTIKQTIDQIKPNTLEGQKRLTKTLIEKDLNKLKADLDYLKSKVEMYNLQNVSEIKQMEQIINDIEQILSKIDNAKSSEELDQLKKEEEKKVEEFYQLKGKVEDKIIQSQIQKSASNKEIGALKSEIQQLQSQIQKLQEEKQNQGTNFIWFLIPIGLLLVTAIVFGIWFLLKKGQKNTSSVNEESEDKQHSDEDVVEDLLITHPTEINTQQQSKLLTEDDLKELESVEEKEEPLLKLEEVEEIKEERPNVETRKKEEPPVEENKNEEEKEDDIEELLKKL
jgi:hypothetical protein